MDTRGRERNVIALDPPILSAPGPDLLLGASLFLDIDGTLLELGGAAAEPYANQTLRSLLDQLKVRLDGRLALVSGRSLDQIDKILGAAAAELAVMGGMVCGDRRRGVWARPNRPETLVEAVERMRTFADEQPGLLVEEQASGVALHYRILPDAEPAARAVAEALASELDLALQYGKMKVELKVAGGDKGNAVRRLMSRPFMHGSTPIFVGDDMADEPGFSVAREFGGHGILIGKPRASAADYRLESPAELRKWLAGALS